MLEIMGTNYYIDIDQIINKCRAEYKNQEISEEKKSKSKKSDESTEDEPLELNVFKYELYKMCLERIIMYENDEVDNNLGVFNPDSLNMSYKLAFNTLLKNNIIKEHESYE